MAQSRLIGTCVTRVRASESCAFSDGPARRGRGSHGTQWRRRRRRQRRQGRQGVRSLDASGGLRTMQRRQGRQGIRGLDAPRAAGGLGTAAARLAPAPPGTELGTTGAGLGSPKQRLEPAGALRQGRPGRQQEPPGLRPVLGPGVARAPRRSGSLARSPGRDCCGARGSGHGPGALLPGCAGSGPCPRAVAGDRFGRRRTRLARRCVGLAARRPA